MYFQRKHFSGKNDGDVDSVNYFPNNLNTINNIMLL